MNDKNKKSSALFTPSGCLTGDALMLFVSGNLVGSQLSMAQQHIADCPLCADAADGLRMWLKENKTGAENASEVPGNLDSETSELNVQSSKSSGKVANTFHARTDVLNNHIKQRLHTHALIEASENKRLSYQPFVWLAVAASVVLFVSIFYVVWIQKLTDMQKLAQKAAEEMELAAREDALIKPATDTANIYVLALNKQRNVHANEIAAEVSEDMVSDLEIVNNDQVAEMDLPETKPVTYSAAESEMAYDGKAGEKDTMGLNNTNPPTEIAGVVVTAYGIRKEKKSMGYSVTEEIADQKVSGAAVQKSERSSKTEKESEKAVFTVVEEMPSFPGGDAERQKFLAENIVYPPQAAENGIQGTVYISFIVNAKGQIEDVRIIRGIGGGCDEEALRVVKMMPRWKPGRQDNKPVRVLYTMPVLFKLQN